ncbi:hypothetical protein F2Q69_00036378 [Brassica cretica]|uniref:Uncharacterized protein n=1 Tax=Brassica cretica TaxID=69181 RepID=A0A8S9STT1_BRACR|nr:hypothetical protein F2Q69_00036378 [Brassica cretica]
MELRPSSGLEDRSYRASTRPSQPSQQANVNSRVRLDLDRARLDLDREVSQNDFSKARIIQLSEDLDRISTLLHQATDCPDRPAFVQLLTAATSTWANVSRHQPKILVSCRVILQLNRSFLVGLDITFQSTIEADSIIRPFRNLVCRLSNHQISLLWRVHIQNPGVETIKGSQKSSRTCYLASFKDIEQQP